MIPLNNLRLDIRHHQRCPRTYYSVHGTRFEATWFHILECLLCCFECSRPGQRKEREKSPVVDHAHWLVRPNSWPELYCVIIYNCIHIFGDIDFCKGVVYPMLERHRNRRSLQTFLLHTRARPTWTKSRRFTQSNARRKERVRTV